MRYLFIILALAFTSCTKVQPKVQPKARADHECIETSLYTGFTLDDKLIASNCSIGRIDSCGVHLDNCTDGFEYNCLVNVKIKDELKKVCP